MGLREDWPTDPPPPSLCLSGSARGEVTSRNKTTETSMSIPNKSTAFRNEPVFSSIRAAATQVAKAKANALARSQSGAIKQVNQAQHSVKKAS